ncbi:MAG: ESX-1 secretion-associated protein [Actinobacteria bacterium]|nr:ESX-1 secretion-associated protein [Actinomycetota bacterium]
MSGDLRVTTAHVRELAAKQGQAAAEITSATEMVDGIDSRVRWTHGVIAWATAGAVEAAQQARRDAGATMSTASSELADRLAVAATRYDAIDAAMRAKLDDQMPR